MNRYIVFLEVVTRGSFSQAAAALGYTQSAVSQMIAALEAEVGVRLLQRSHRGVTLTAEGQALLPQLEQLVHQYRTFENQVTAVQGLVGGEIRIGTISSVTRQWLPRVIREFEQQYPQVRFVFHQGDYLLNRQWITSGEVDFGIVTPPAVPELTTIPFWQPPMLAVLNPHNPLAKLPVVPLKALADQAYIMVEQGDYSEALNAFAAEGVTPNIKFTIHDDYAIMGMVEAGLGFSILSAGVLDRMPFDVVTRPTDPPLELKLALGFKDRAAMPLASQRFVDYMLTKRR